MFQKAQNKVIADIRPMFEVRIKNPVKPPPNRDFLVFGFCLGIEANKIAEKLIERDIRNPNYVTLRDMDDRDAIQYWMSARISISPEMSLCSVGQSFGESHTNVDP